MESLANLVEDYCAEPSCRMSILVEKDDKQTGRKNLCTACLMRQKMGRR